MNSFSGIYAGKRILLTGHTGFKGAWLAEWLLSLGAEAHGYGRSTVENLALSAEASSRRLVQVQDGLGQFKGEQCKFKQRAAIAEVDPNAQFL